MRTLALALLLAAPAAAAPSWEAQVSQARGALGSAFAASAQDCGSPWVSVSAQTPEDAALACQGFKRALRFMAEQGAAPKTPVNIVIADRFPERYAKYGVDNMHGFYDTDTREVHMKSYRRFAQTPPESTPLGVAPSRELLVSYIAHEVGHHISVQAYAGAAKLIPHAHGEFISYSLQLATMEESLREELVRLYRMDGRGGFGSTDQINMTIHDMDPQAFAVKSYLFFTAPEGKAALRGMLAGTVPDAGL
ncbi:MAG: hypothetical protein HY926_09750 [Elusimicrobia bacterium]|nr:hypothetical protein [Elusimicrobiota bacterium]